MISNPVDKLIWWYIIPVLMSVPNTWGGLYRDAVPSDTCVLRRELHNGWLGGWVNASVHDEAQNYRDKVCHLILCSFHHKLKEKHTRGQRPTNFYWSHTYLWIISKFKKKTKHFEQGKFGMLYVAFVWHLHLQSSTQSDHLTLWSEFPLLWWWY